MEVGTPRSTRRARFHDILEHQQPSHRHHDKSLNHPWLADQHLEQHESNENIIRRRQSLQDLTKHPHSDSVYHQTIDLSHKAEPISIPSPLRHVPIPTNTDAILSLSPVVNSVSILPDSWHQSSRVQRMAHENPNHVRTTVDPNHITHADHSASSEVPFSPKYFTNCHSFDVSSANSLRHPQKTPHTTSIHAGETHSNTPFLSSKPDVGLNPKHFSMNSYKWFDDDNESYAPTHQRLPNRSMNHIFDQPQQMFRPSEKLWQTPEEDSVLIPRKAWIYLPLIGAVTFLLALVINVLSQALSKSLTYLSSLPSAGYRKILGVRGNDWLTSYVDVTSLALIRGASLVIAFAFVLKFSPYYAAGSGIPEMRCVFGGILMPRMLDWETLVGKLGGLVFALASDISIGTLGPFIHIGCITASLVSNIPSFPSLHENGRFQLQALSAAMAAGAGATFGAPIGGTLLSIEIMTAHYYTSWLPIATYCSIAGYSIIIMFTPVQSLAYFETSVVSASRACSIMHIFIYVLLGALCGVIGATLVHFTKFAFSFRQRYFKNSTWKKTAGMLFIFAATHTLIGYFFGGVLGMSQREAVTGLFSADATSSEQLLPDRWSFPAKDIRSTLALIILSMTKFVLTGLSLVLPVPSGTFLPIFEVGALLGRSFGQFCCSIPILNWLDPRMMAIVGAAAVATGALHTTTVVVVIMELTKGTVEILPLAVGVIVAYGVSKRLCSDLFSELIRIRRLPCLLGLRERYPWETKQFHEDAASKIAGSFMRKKFHFVTPHTTRAEIYDMLIKEGRPWKLCALLSDRASKHFWGTIRQDYLWDIVKEDMPIEASGKYREPEYGTFNVSDQGILRGMETVDFLKNFAPDEGHPLVDRGAMQVSYHTPFWKIVDLFQVLSLSQLWVVKDGVTVGYLSKGDVISQSMKLERRAKRRHQKEMNLEALRRHDDEAMARWMGQGHFRNRSRGQPPKVPSRVGAGHVNQKNKLPSHNHNRIQSVNRSSGAVFSRDHFLEHSTAQEIHRCTC